MLDLSKRQVLGMCQSSKYCTYSILTSPLLSLVLALTWHFSHFSTVCLEFSFTVYNSTSQHLQPERCKWGKLGSL